jgi:hypothetical protein
MPIKSGLEFLEEQLSRECHCKNMALMSGDLGQKDIERASSLKIKVFKKPFEIKEIGEWVSDIEKRINSGRRFSSFFLENHTGLQANN